MRCGTIAGFSWPIENPNSGQHLVVWIHERIVADSGWAMGLLAHCWFPRLCHWWNWFRRCLAGRNVDWNNSERVDSNQRQRMKNFLGQILLILANAGQKVDCNCLSLAKRWTLSLQQLLVNASPQILGKKMFNWILLLFVSFRLKHRKLREIASRIYFSY